MALKKRVREIKANIPTASMADIAFLLIIFFMVTTKFHVDRTSLSLPLSEVRMEVPKGSGYVVIFKQTGTEYGFKFSDGDQTSEAVAGLSDLEIRVATKIADDPLTPFVVKADAKTPYQYIDDVIEVLRNGGVEEIVLLTDQRTIEDAL